MKLKLLQGVQLVQPHGGFDNSTTVPSSPCRRRQCISDATLTEMEGCYSPHEVSPVIVPPYEACKLPGNGCLYDIGVFFPLLRVSL
ncbi:hypothetical protein GCWU000342_00151 [Shuttleworthella satelles DSM 14600]|uniref:Uncharacterized protein n=1 Tax=Shuttleworthella satelles DSM 14600 TaxID=626523 RepID=C4G866_9FIRM|nr:hypothetical protein GCWU000342_00151 [Shuttleworthia satelles DSM 14600]